MTWEKIKRASGLIEYVCKHNIGHPDYQSAVELDKKYNNKKGTWATHGCDGCCTRDDFPGKLKQEEYEK